MDFGFVLGSVKFNGFFFWDLDGDLFFLFLDVVIFGKKEIVEYFWRNGFELIKFKLIDDGYFKINFNRFYIGVWGMLFVLNIWYFFLEL